MAAGKQKPTAAGRKARAPLAVARTTEAPRPAATPRPSNPQQLMREAAWSRMFGRTESKNPFTR
jgi:hypothetical protein